MTYEQEQDELLRSFMNRTFFEAWAHPEKEDRNPIFYGNYKQLELNISPHCDLNCTYCYLNKHEEEFYPSDTLKTKTILKNTDILIEWLYENNYSPTLEIFSGDPLVQNIGHEIIELLIDKAKKHGRPVSNFLSIPTNMGVLHFPDKLERLEKNIAEAEKVGFRIGLSASVDGPFMEDNRPSKGKTHRNEKFYNDLFTFAKKYGIGFHPMIYANGIKRWKDNFLWFQDKFKEYDLPWYGIYLLEVRNWEWSQKQSQDFYEFLYWLVHWTWDKCNHDINRFARGYFNIMGSVLTTTGRGIGCSIQSSLQVRVGDLTWGPCHRLMYEKFEAGYFEVKDDKIVGIKAKNVETYIGINSANSSEFPECEHCAIKHFCSAGCLGANYETTGDLFNTNPSVCRMEHYKVTAIFHAMQDIGILTDITSNFSEERRLAVMNLINNNII
jgi:radical SAM protein with 4Fe4S-binding SPASM domain